jgi:hypothetical protein
MRPSRPTRPSPHPKSRTRRRSPLPTHRHQPASCSPESIECSPYARPPRERRSAAQHRPALCASGRPARRRELDGPHAVPLARLSKGSITRWKRLAEAPRAAGNAPTPTVRALPELDGQRRPMLALAVREAFDPCSLKLRHGSSLALARPSHRGIWRGPCTAWARRSALAAIAPLTRGGRQRRHRSHRRRTIEVSFYIPALEEYRALRFGSDEQSSAEIEYRVRERLADL